MAGRSGPLSASCKVVSAACCRCRCIFSRHEIWPLTRRAGSKCTADGKLNFSLDAEALVRGSLRLVDAYLQAGLDALGDATRMAIFQRLANGPIAVNELARHLPVSWPAVSQHLKVLKDAGLVTDMKEGTRRLYQL